uniref:NADH-ubiquinone oxidoreductase chain 5 n=1 Tax=Sinaechinocyamus mai TaxID=2661602 RepID=A0A5P8T0G5_9ECHN|nr:NADH dehydrogenase subunit 5 [Sinaechinocyamus mai]
MVISPHFILPSLNLSIIVILLLSIFFFSKSYLFNTMLTLSNNSNIIGISTHSLELQQITSFNAGPFIMNILKFLAILSIPSLIISTYLEFQQFNITFSFWINNTSTNISLNFLYDQYFLIFLTVALMVTWSIMEFSYYYMSEDPNNTAFFRLLTIFLLNMVVLTCSNSLFLIFLGWEGVGFLSFLLISWWSTRNDASSSALEAVIYNRIGDIGLILFMSLSILLFNSWNINEILFLNLNCQFSSFLIFGLILAAAGKSAQFGLHPWLPAAMEGPTPVSALLHSSTMVVAGVFLLVRTSDLISLSSTWQAIILLMGGITAIFAASTAIAQNDIKKIIAYSTTSQLGLMVTSIGIGSPLLAFFHICTHAFFKAMLFLCSGSIIHSLNDEQDLRKMGGLSNLLPVTSACLALGSLALMGTPFLAGFYSKDLILEATGAGITNTLGIVLSISATLLTAAYSFRIIMFCLLNNPSISSLSPIGEENSNLTSALIRLALGTIIVGWFFSTFILNTPSFSVPNSIKSLPLVVTVAGTFLSISLLTFLVTTKTPSPQHSSLALQWFFVDLSHSLITFLSFVFSLFFTNRTLDRGWQENIGPQGIGNISSSVSKINQTSQNGLIKQYISSSLLALLIIIIGLMITS